MVWFRRSESAERPASKVPEGLWVKCDGCRETLYRKELERGLFVCPRCGHHHRVSARTRLSQLFDGGNWKEVFGNIFSTDPLEFVDQKPYSQRLRDLREKGIRSDAMLIGVGRLSGIRVVIDHRNHKIGAVYQCRCNHWKHGRLYRPFWNGSGDHPGLS